MQSALHAEVNCMQSELHAECIQFAEYCIIIMTTQLPSSVMKTGELIGAT